MFKFLKEKIGKWTKKISEKETKIEEKPIEEEKLKKQIKKEKIGRESKNKKQKKGIKTKEKKPIEKKTREKLIKKKERLIEEEISEKDKQNKGEKAEEKSIEEKETEKKDISLPMKFNSGTQKYEPDLEKLDSIIDQKEIPSKGFFSRIKEKIQNVKISEEDFEEYSEDLEMILLENNVALEISDIIIKELKEEIVGKEISKKNIGNIIKNTLKNSIEKILVEPFDLEKEIKTKKETPYVILLCGINGSGKTTTIAKLANYFKKKGISSILAAGDTFRAASIEQLKKHGKNLDINVISHEYGSDPAAVGFDAIAYAKKNSIDCVLIDTAGRMHTAKNLLREMEKIVRVCKPDKKIFVGESITGNDSTEQVRSFDETIGIDGIILSKADVDEKGGTAISVGKTTGKPILFLGTGQEYEKIEKFDKKKFIEKLGL
jgi:fused signal recognition particle receptor